MKFLKKANLQEEIQKALRMQKEQLEKQYQEKIEQIIEEINWENEKKLLHLQNEIVLLENKITADNKFKRMAETKLKKAEALLIKAKNFIIQIDLAMKNHTEATAIAYTEINEAKNRIQDFAASELRVELK